MFIKFKLPVAMLVLIALSVLCSSVYVQETRVTKLISNRLPVDTLSFQSQTASNPLVASQSALHHMQSLPKLMTTSWRKRIKVLLPIQRLLNISHPQKCLSSHP